MSAQNYSAQLQKFKLLSGEILISQLSCGLIPLTLHLDSDFFVLLSSGHNSFFQYYLVPPPPGEAKVY